MGAGRLRTMREPEGADHLRNARMRMQEVSPHSRDWVRWVVAVRRADVQPPDGAQVGDLGRRGACEASRGSVLLERRAGGPSSSESPFPGMWPREGRRRRGSVHGGRLAGGGLTAAQMQQPLAGAALQTGSDRLARFSL